MTVVIALADGIKNNGAMTSLNIGSNNIPIETMNEIIAIVEAKPAMKVLCAVPFRDKTITELDVSGQSLGVEGTLVIRRYLENNGALVKFTISGEQYYMGRYGCWKDAPPVTIEASMTEADFSGKHLGASAAIMLATFLPKCQ